MQTTDVMNRADDGLSAKFIRRYICGDRGSHGLETGSSSCFCVCTPCRPPHVSFWASHCNLPSLLAINLGRECLVFLTQASSLSDVMPPAISLALDDMRDLRLPGQDDPRASCDPGLPLTKHKWNTVAQEDQKDIGHRASEHRIASSQVPFTSRARDNTCNHGRDNSSTSLCGRRPGSGPQSSFATGVRVVFPYRPGRRDADASLRP